jgi:hypothetical protein
MFRDSGSTMNLMSAVSAVSISVGTQFTSLYLQQDGTAAAELKGFLSAQARNPSQTSVHLSSNPGVFSLFTPSPKLSQLNPKMYPGVFSSVIPSVSKLRAAAGALLLDLCTALPRKLLVDVASEDSWAVGKLSSSSDSEAVSYRADENVLPQQFFTQVE